MPCHSAKQPHALPIYKLNMLMHLLFTPCTWDINIYVCEDIYKNTFTYLFSLRPQIKPGLVRYLMGKEMRLREVPPTELGKKLRYPCSILSISCHFAMRASRNRAPKRIPISPDCILLLGFPLREWLYYPITQAENLDVFLDMSYVLIIISLLTPHKYVPCLFTHCCCPHYLSPGPL